MAVQTLPAPRQMRADETVKGFMERTFGEGRGKEGEEEGGVKGEDDYYYFSSSCEEVKKEEGKEEEDCKIKVEECEEV